MCRQVAWKGMRRDRAKNAMLQLIHAKKAHTQVATYILLFSHHFIQVFCTVRQYEFLYAEHRLSTHAHCKRKGRRVINGFLRRFIGELCVPKFMKNSIVFSLDIVVFY